MSDRSPPDSHPERISSPTGAAEPPGDHLDAEFEPVPEPRRRRTLVWLIGVAAALIVVALFAVPYLWSLLSSDEQTATPGLPPPAASTLSQAAPEPPAAGGAGLAALRREVAELRQALAAQADLAARVAALEQAGEQPAASAEDGTAAAVPDSVLDRLAAVEEKLAALGGGEGDGALEQLPELAGQLGDLEQQVHNLAVTASVHDTRLDNQETVLKQPSEDIVALREEVERQGEELAAQAQQVAEIQSTTADAGSDARRIGLMLALNQLGEAAREAPGGYARELQAVQELGETLPEEPLQTLESHAGGAPSRLALERSFTAVSRDILDAAAQPAPDDPWWQWTLSRLASLVSIRRTGSVEGAGADAIVARAEERLQSGDLAGAVSELEGLEDAAAEAAAPWLEAARSRLAIETAVAELQAALASNGEGSGPLQ